MTIKAWEAKSKSIEAQFDLAIKAIETEISHGETEAELDFGSGLDESVAEKLTEMGYDIKFLYFLGESEPYILASWEYAEQGRKGRILVEIEPNKFIMNLPEAELDEILSEYGLSEPIMEFSFEGDYDSIESLFDGDITFEPTKRNLFNFEENNDESNE